MSGASAVFAHAFADDLVDRGFDERGQENQLDTLGIMINIIVLWQTIYTQAALDHLDANGHHPHPADVARLSPLGHPTINLNGRYHTTEHPPTSGLRPLRTTP